MVLGIWDSIGNHGHRKHPHGLDHHDHHGHDTSSQQSEGKYFNNHIGFGIGYLSLVLTATVIIIYIIVINTVGYSQTVEDVIFIFDMIIKLIMVIAIPVTMYQMSVLTTKDMEIKKLRCGEHAKHGHSIVHVLDSNLLTVTFLAGLLFQMFTVVAAVLNESPFITADAIISMVLGNLQTFFINAYSNAKRSTKEEHHCQKPGRQGLEILRCSNLALWAFHTFIVKHPEAKRIHVNTFGFAAWTIISNITQPLNILYHFHAAACIAEIIHRAYTSKYLGIRRIKRGSIFAVASSASIGMVVPTKGHRNEYEELHGDSASGSSIDNNSSTGSAQSTHSSTNM